MTTDSRLPDLPLLHDHHSHTSLYAALEGCPSLLGLGKAEALSLLLSQSRDSLGLVKGWRTDLLPLGAGELAGLPPLLIVNFSLHGYALTPAALPFVGELWPEFAERHADPAWGESHLPELFGFYGRLAGLTPAKLKTHMEGLEALGIGSIEDMTTAGSEALAVIAASPYSRRVLSWATPSVYEGLSEAERRGIQGIKLFLDGSLGARSAAIGRPFLGGGKGILVYKEEELESLLSRLAAYKTGLSLHAIGGLAIDQALLVLERLARNGLSFSRIRLEHVQFIDRSQALRARGLGIVLSMQPNFNTDSVDYLDRLPPELAAANDPFRMLIDEAGFRPGQDLVFGSDGMPHGPGLALEACLSPPAPGQRLSLEEFIAGYGPALS